METELLIVYVKNPVPGRVKTRLAKDIGEEEACEIYIKLLAHTRSVVGKLDKKIRVSYADQINPDDLWNEFEKVEQTEGDLGERMALDLKRAFDQGYSRVCLIGSDTFEITGEILSEAFDKLRFNDSVIGPAKDGGYYLIGLNSNTSFTHLFEGIAWSTSEVLAKTMEKFESQSTSVGTLPTLRDIDTAEDLTG